MADYDRGAYTPQTDAPLAFDPRRPSERRPMPMALIGSAVVLVVLLAGVAMVYRSGVRHAGEAPRPVGEPVMSVKSAPAPDADAAKTPPANLDVYNESAAAAPAVPSAANTAPAGPAPAFTPPPEQPAVRPAPKPETLTMLAKPPPVQAARSTPAERAAVTPAPIATAPLKPAAPAATSAQGQGQGQAQAKPQKMAKLDQSEVAEAGMTRASAATVAANDEAPQAAAHAAAKPVAKPAAAAPAGAAATDPTGSVVQIGAFSSDALAHKGYADMSTAMGGQMTGKVRHIQPLQRDGKTLYRTWVSGFASHAEARVFCDALKAKGKTCITKG